MKVEYKVGDIILAELPYLQECEIEEISIRGKCMKIKGEWHTAESVTSKIRCTLGKAIYKRYLFWVVRSVNYS